MTDTIRETMYIEEFEGHPPIARFIGGRYLGLMKFNGALVPPAGRFTHAHYRTQIELSQEPVAGETEIEETEATIVGRFESPALGDESWFRIETDRVDWTGEHTRPRELVPDWITDEDDEGFIEIELTYDEELTREETGWSPAEIEVAREEVRREYYE